MVSFKYFLHFLDKNLPTYMTPIIDASRQKSNDLKYEHSPSPEKQTFYNWIFLKAETTYYHI